MIENISKSDESTLVKPELTRHTKSKNSLKQQITNTNQTQTFLRKPPEVIEVFARF
jgi:hypothetical protein